MFGFLRKKEKSSAYLLGFEQEWRLRKVERDIARLKAEFVELLISRALAKADSEGPGEKKDGTPE